jgi:hypothetical protein
LLYFSSCFYLKCVTVSKWLCFTLHNLFTYSYYLFFSCLFTGYHSHPVRGLRRARDAAGGGRATLSCPPPAHALSCHLKHFFWELLFTQNLNIY